MLFSIRVLRALHALVVLKRLVNHAGHVSRPILNADFELRPAGTMAAFRFFFCFAGRGTALAATFFLAGGALTLAFSLIPCFRSLVEDETVFVRRLVDRPEDVLSDLLLLVFSDFFVDFLRAAIRLSTHERFFATPQPVAPNQSWKQQT